ncbi:MAG: 50S ribosomal protein L21e [Nitrososphaerota archaeon]
MTRHSGFRARCRAMLTREVGERAGPKPEVYLSEIPIGSKVSIIIDPATHRGSPHRRYHGKIGEIVEKRGRGYIVAVKVGSKRKLLSLLPEHIRPFIQG